MKRLYRSRNERTFAGILGGIANYFGIDPVIPRIIYTLLTLFTFGVGGILGYFILIFVIPIEPAGNRPYISRGGYEKKDVPERPGSSSGNYEKGADRYKNYGGGRFKRK